MLGKILILGVASEWGLRKGLEVFVKLAKELPEKYEIYMVGVEDEVKKHLPSRIHSIQKTNNINELRTLYSIADVFLNPTIQDNFPTVNLEAVTCGTPVLTYNTGGSPENSYTRNCVVEQGDYNTLKKLILECEFENALQSIDCKLLSKKSMMERYLALFMV